MEDQKTARGRLALIGLTVLTVLTLVIFALLFLNMKDIFSGTTQEPETENSDSSSDSVSTDGEQNSTLIVELQTQMNNLQNQLDSPYLIFVNESNPIPEGYTVDLTSLDGENSEFSLEKAAAEKLQQFLDDAKNVGFPIVLSSAYRSAQDQETLFNNAVQDYMNGGYPLETARSMAARKVGSVDCSEHQTGLAVDFNMKDFVLVGNNGETFEEYLTENIYKYGFILSYPAEREETEREANTAHYRYVGIEAATVITEEQWILAEYRDHLQIQIDYRKQQIASYQK